MVLTAGLFGGTWLHAARLLYRPGHSCNHKLHRGLVAEELEVLALVPVTVQAAVLVGLVLLLVVVWREELVVEVAAVGAVGAVGVVGVVGMVGVVGVVGVVAAVAQDLVVVWGKGRLSCGGKILAEISEICAISGICAIS